MSAGGGVFRASDQEVTEYGRGLLKRGWRYAGTTGRSHLLFVHDATGTELRLPNSPHGWRWKDRAKSVVRQAERAAAS